MTMQERDDAVRAVALAALHATPEELARAFGRDPKEPYLLDLHYKMRQDLPHFICKLDLGYCRAFVDMAVRRQRTTAYAVCSPDGHVLLRGSAKAMRQARKKLGKGYYTTLTACQVGETHSKLKEE